MPGLVRPAMMEVKVKVKVKAGWLAWSTVVVS